MYSQQQKSFKDVGLYQGLGYSSDRYDHIFASRNVDFATLV